jgi:hypothetical protein
MMEEIMNFQDKELELEGLRITIMEKEEEMTKFT